MLWGSETGAAGPPLKISMKSLAEKEERNATTSHSYSQDNSDGIVGELW